MTTRTAIVLLLAVSGAAPSFLSIESTAHTPVALTDGRYEDTQPRYSPDGTRIAFASVRDGRPRVFIMPATGGAAVQVTGEYSALSPTWSPDGRRLAFISDMEGTPALWVIPVDGGQANRITPPSFGASWPDWSPDGSRIAFISDQDGNWNVYTIAATGGQPSQITRHTGNEWQPRWSPDSTQIAFYSTWNHEMTDIWTIAASGGEPKRITDHAAEDYQPAWSPDGRRLAFFSRRGGTTQIWASPSSGGAAVPLTSPETNLYGGSPDWSRDGGAIVFNLAPRQHLFKVRIDDRRETQITDGVTSQQNPSVSPDGRQIVFTSMFFGPERHLTLTDASGGSRRLLSINDGQNHRPRILSSPVWSRDGTRIAFVHSFGGYLDSGDLWVISARGRDVKRLTQVGFVGAPVWCDDDTSIAFTARGAVSRDGNFNVVGGQIWKVAASGGTPVQLTSDTGNHYPTDYSPSLKRLILHKAVAGSNQLFLLPTTGGALEPFRSGLRVAEGARWSRDGSRVAFVSNQTGADEIYVMPASGGPARRLTNSGRQKGVPTWSPDGREIVFGMVTRRSTIARVVIPPR